MSWKHVGGTLAMVAFLSLVVLQLQTFAQDKDKGGGKEPPKGLFDKKPDAPPKVNFEDILKNLPKDLDPQIVEKIKKQLEDLQKPGVIGGPFPFPAGDKGGFPFPGDKGFPFPGGFPGGFPGMPGFGKLSPGRLGIEAVAPNEVLVDQLDLPAKKGLVIEKVVADSAAAKAGLKKNDILLEF